MSKWVVGSSMRRRFGGSTRNFDQVQATFLTTTEHGRLFIDRLLAEEERSQNTAGVFLPNAIPSFENLIKDGLLGIKRIGAVLTEIPDLGVMTFVDLPVLRLKHSGQELE